MIGYEGLVPSLRSLLTGKMLTEPAKESLWHHGRRWGKRQVRIYYIRLVIVNRQSVQGFGVRMHKKKGVEKLLLDACLLMD